MALHSTGGGYNSYKTNEVSTSSPIRLVIMLYEGAIRFLNIALENIHDQKKYDVVNTNIIKAQEIINELMTTLNMEEGGKIASDLLGIYVFMKKNLVEANIEKSGQKIRETVKMMNSLKTGWEEIEKKQDSSPDRPKAGGLSIQS